VGRRKPYEPQKGLARAVKDLRSQANLDQSELAELAGLSTSWISRIESGDYNPPWGSMRLVAKGLGMSLAELAELAEQMEIKAAAKRAS
jgi:transcriptional regulator with XRE-family HTH domain